VDGYRIGADFDVSWIATQFKHKYYVVLRTAFSLASYVTIPEKHLQTNGFKRVEIDDAKRHKFEQVIIPFAVSNELLGQWIIDLGLEIGRDVLVDGYVMILARADRIGMRSKQTQLISVFGDWENSVREAKERHHQ
jgi:hypothetical protein